MRPVLCAALFLLCVNAQQFIAFDIDFNDHQIVVRPLDGVNNPLSNGTVVACGGLDYIPPFATYDRASMKYYVSLITTQEGVANSVAAFDGNTGKLLGTTFIHDEKKEKYIFFIGLQFSAKTNLFYGALFRSAAKGDPALQFSTFDFTSGLITPKADYPKNRYVDIDDIFDAVIDDYNGIYYTTSPAPGGIYFCGAKLDTANITCDLVGEYTQLLDVDGWLYAANGTHIVKLAFSAEGKAVVTPVVVYSLHISEAGVTGVINPMSRTLYLWFYYPDGSVGKGSVYLNPGTFNAPTPVPENYGFALTHLD